MNIPGGWDPEHMPNLVDVYNCRTWIWHQIGQWENEARQSRILKWKDKVRGSKSENFSYVYQHLKNKSLEEPANLVTDSEGNIVFQPTDALEKINQQWDSVFSANVLHSDPMKVMEIVWPYIKDSYHDFTLPALTADDLYRVVQNRKNYAAPGLDGWRTCELQVLPKTCFDPIARFFRQLEENQDDIPKTLLCAKQMILNKNGRSEPLQKRLITVMPALLLAYTGARYKQLQGWQQTTMPSQLVGGIKNRYMTHIAFDLRMQMDKAEIDNTSLIGIKLDKSKCFDRIIPSYVAALLLAFGMDRKLVNFFLKMYKGLHRHLFYKGWAAADATTPANGVAQGCSLSLIAINVYSKVWVCLMSALPEVSVRAFVDDAYLWTHITNVAILEKALAVTELWDYIAGQKLNADKSVVWGTSTEARKAAKMHFPNMQIKLEFDLLGSIMYTSRRSAYAFSEEKTAKIIADTRNISALPLPRAEKAKLVGAKIIPQCTYTAGLSNMPKHSIGRIQTEIVHVLWQKRRPWRARWLVITLLGQPHRIEPHFARAYHTIMDFLRFFHAHLEHKPLIMELLAAPSENKHGLAPKLREACACFGIHIHGDLTLTWRNSQQIPIEALTAKDSRKTLQTLAVNAAYHNSADTKRKDLSKPTGVIDRDLTLLFTRKSKLQTSTPFPADALFENQIVGAAPTRDRLFAAKLHDDSQCRFCNQEKESMSHFIECPSVREKIGAVPHHEFGPNFDLLGIFEHPYKIAEHRLRYTALPAVNPDPFEPHAPYQSVWSDGSVVWNENYWLESGGFSLVNEKGNLIVSGPVSHWHMSSYTTELYALAYAILIHQTPLRLFMDCQTVVHQFRQLVSNMAVDTGWSHQEWWRTILQQIQQRKQFISNPVEVHWIPAHAYENLPTSAITNELAQAKQTTIQHIYMNRLADMYAKRAATENGAVHPRDQSLLYNAVLEKHEWLVKLGELMYCDVQNLQLAANQKT